MRKPGLCPAAGSAGPGVLHRLLSLGLCALIVLGCSLPLRRSKPPTTPSLRATVIPTQGSGRSVASTKSVFAKGRGTVSAGQRALPSPTPSPVPTQTLTPAMRLALAQQAAEDGDYALAIALWEEALALAEPAQRAALAISLARAYMEEQRFPEAIARLKQAAAEASSPPEKAEALGLLARCYEARGEWREVLAAYAGYLELEQDAAPYVRLAMAKAYEALGEDAEAAKQLEAVELAELPPAERAEVLEELAAVRRRLGDDKGALAAYESILQFSRLPEYRALIQYKKGEALRAAGREEEALAVLRGIFQEYPNTRAARSALAALDELGAEGVDDLLRAEILCRAGEYAASIEVLKRYAETHGEENAPRVHYDLGLAYEGLEQYPQAFKEYDLLIEDYPQDPLAPAAWMAKARAAAAYGGDPSGLYHEFAKRYPDHPRAPEALWLGGVALERAGDWSGAAAFYQRLAALYPQDQRAPEAKFRQGLALYALRDAAGALKVWAEAPLEELSPEERARRLVWLGLAARAAGEAEAARRYWREAFVASPTSYYGLRAADLEAGATLRLSPEVSGALPEGKLGEHEWKEIGLWVRGWHRPAGSEEGTAIAQPSPTPAGPSAEEKLARRGAALLRLGWRERVLTTYQMLRDQLRDDPEALLALAHTASEAGLYALALSCAERLIALGAKANAPEPPRALLKLAYPTYYGHLVRAEAEGNAVDPLLFLALIRQESRFDPQAVSYAGATGLAQVMPETGKWIASRLGVEPFSTRLLERPIISVRFGVWYLVQALELFDRDWILALAAYNAGPGSVRRWTGGQAVADHDLFIETIPYAQTRDYVRRVYEHYRRYEELYRRPHALEKLPAD